MKRNKQSIEVDDMDDYFTKGVVNLVSKLEQKVTDQQAEIDNYKQIIEKQQSVIFKHVDEIDELVNGIATAFNFIEGIKCGDNDFDDDIRYGELSAHSEFLGELITKHRGE